MEIVLAEMNLEETPVFKSWRLNERHYGALQGLNKSQAARRYGQEQVEIWRRGYCIAPPSLTRDDSRFPGNDTLYTNVNIDDLPLTESLKDTMMRLLPYWHSPIELYLRQKKQVLVVAHGNSLRALIKYLDGISDEDIPKFEIPTGIPLVYEMDELLRPLNSYYINTYDLVR